MKRNISVNIKGNLFNIDEDAYNLLENYFADISIQFADAEYKQGIINDIERKISQYLLEFTDQDAKAITIEDINKVLALFGYKNENISDYEIKKFKKRNIKKIFRNPKDKYLFGVCGGLSKYFNIDSVWLRIIFVILTFLGGIGFILYLILWLIKPKALSPTDFLSMQGKPFTVFNIKETIKNNFQTDNLSRQKVGFLSRQKPDNIYKFKIKGRDVFRFLIFTPILFVVLFIFIGLIFLFLKSDNIFLGLFPYKFKISEISEIIFNATWFIYLIKIVVFLIFSIPLIGLLVNTLRKAAGLSFKIENIKTATIAIWFTSILTLFLISLYTYFQFLFIEKSVDVYSIPGYKFRTLTVELQKNTDKVNIDNTNKSINRFYVAGKDSTMYKTYGIPQLFFDKSSNDTAYVNIYKKTYGKSNLATLENLKQIIYTPEMNKDTLFLPMFYSVNNKLWRAQNVKVEILIPENKSLNISKEFISFHESNNKNFYNYSATKAPKHEK